MTKEMSVLAPVGNLDSYIRAAYACPMLSQEEEQQLASNLQIHDDLDAAKQLILSHLRFVIHIARQYSGYGLPQADLIQEGNIGLMKAVRRFNPDVGVRLVSFAVHWVKSEIHEYGFAPIFPDICYHLPHYKPAAADIPVASDNPAHYADAIRYNARTPLQGSLLPLTRLVWA